MRLAWLLIGLSLGLLTGFLGGIGTMCLFIIHSNTSQDTIDEITADPELSE